MKTNAKGSNKRRLNTLRHSVTSGGYMPVLQMLNITRKDSGNEKRRLYPDQLNHGMSTCGYWTLLAVLQEGDSRSRRGVI